MVFGVQDGQAVSEGVTNPAFIVKNADDIAYKNVALQNTDPLDNGSLGWVGRLQREFNSITSFAGSTLNQVYNYKPTWIASPFGTTSDSLYAKLVAILAALTSGVLSKKSDRIALSSGISTYAVTFTTAYADNDFEIAVSIENQVDTSPIQFIPVVTARSASGFTLALNALTDTSNYVLHYQVTRTFNP